MGKRTVDSVVEIFDLLTVRELMQITHSQQNAVLNWRAFNAFPPRTYVAIMHALKKRRVSAPHKLWGMIEPQCD
jgi:hypothetical protein